MKTRNLLVLPVLLAVGMAAIVPVAAPAMDAVTDGTISGSELTDLSMADATLPAPVQEDDMCWELFQQAAVACGADPTSTTCIVLGIAAALCFLMPGR